MDNQKISNSYYLDEDNINWLSDEALKEDRSASWYLNELIIAARDKQSKKRKSS